MSVAGFADQCMIFYVFRSSFQNKTWPQYSDTISNFRALQKQYKRPARAAAFSVGSLVHGP